MGWYEYSNWKKKISFLYIFVLFKFPVLRLRSNDTVKSTQAKFLIHTMQVLPQKFCKTLDIQKILPVSIENDTLHYFKVEVRLILSFYEFDFVLVNQTVNLNVLF